MQFVYHVRELAVGMKGQVARPGAVLKLGELWIVGGERSFRSVEAVDKEFVQSEIIHQREAVVGGQVDGVGVRSVLALQICAVTSVLHKGRRFAKSAIF